MSYVVNQEVKPLVIEVNKYLPYYYAGASLDFNLIHIDNEFAKQVGLGGIILQGLCTMAFVYKCVMRDNDPSNLKKLKVRFRHPVKPLDKLTIGGKITSQEKDQTTIELIATNQKGEQVVTNAVAVLY